MFLVSSLIDHFWSSPRICSETVSCKNITMLSQHRSSFLHFSPRWIGEARKDLQEIEQQRGTHFLSMVSLCRARYVARYKCCYTRWSRNSIASKRILQQYCALVLFPILAQVLVLVICKNLAAKVGNLRILQGKNNVGTSMQKKCNLHKHLAEAVSHQPNRWRRR